MKCNLHKKPKAKTLIEGFPGFGLVGTIVTEFLIEHLKCEQIGEFVYDDLPATVAIHKGELVHPMGVYYNKKFNLLILHAILDIKGFEWEIAQAVKKLASDLDVKEVISVEGVTGSVQGDKVYSFQGEEFEKLGAEKINESVIMGVTAALLLREKNLKCLFAETQSQMPDSRAAAKIIELLNAHLKLNLDPKPLAMQAELFEGKLKNILKQTNETNKVAKDKQMSYLG